MPLSEKALENRRKYNRDYYHVHKERDAARRQKTRDARKDQKSAYMREYTTGIKGRAGRLYHGAVRRAKEKGLEVTINQSWIENRLSVGICERTGIRFSFDQKSSTTAPSLDRIESNKGYTPENCQMVCCAYNMGKKHLSDEEYEDFIVAAARHITERRNTDETTH